MNLCSMVKAGLILLLATSFAASAKMNTDTFSFSYEGRRYYGLIDMPAQGPAKGIIVIVPGSGKTNFVSGGGFNNTRNRFTEQGFGCVVWDKAGCGKSEGVFDENEPVQSSAGEAVAAIAALKARHTEGSGKIGLWGISRAGWICPLVIAQAPIAFWISVSGTDGEENFAYLLEKNFEIEGRSPSQAKKLAGGWLRGIEIARTGGTFEENLKATEEVRNDSFYRYVCGSSMPTRERYEAWQKKLQTGEIVVNPATGLVVYVPHFDAVLAKVSCPVLAIFGEKDSQVDWRKTKKLYEHTIGKAANASLTIKVLPDCNHSMVQCKTGGYREDLSSFGTCSGYYDVMVSWLKERSGD